MTDNQIKTKVQKLKVYIEKTQNLITQATDPNKIDFFKREVRKAQYTLEQLTK